MSTTAEQLREGRRTLRSQPKAGGILRSGARGSVLDPWLRGQAINVTRHAAALRPFRREEFGQDAASPNEGHIEEVNKMITQLRANLLQKAGKVTQTVRDARTRPTTRNLQAVVTHKEGAHESVSAPRKILEFYFELFASAHFRFANWCSRVRP